MKKVFYAILPATVGLLPYLYWLPSPAKFIARFGLGATFGSLLLASGKSKSAIGMLVSFGGSILGFRSWM